ncbi:hypothetical protein [Cellulosimicrobium sp. Marseille-Q8652]
MGFLDKMMKSGVALKAARVAQREMSKPENQRKARELLAKVTKREGPAGPAPRP